MGLSLCLLLSLFSSPAFAEELTVGAQVDKSELHIGEKLTFSVTIAGPLRQPPKVHLTGFRGFRVVSSGQSQQIEAGAGQVRQSLTLNYTLAPTAPGTHTLGPVKVEYQGRTVETQPIEVTVVEGPKEPRQEVPELEGGVIL
ncbi:MAG: BatD family protein [Candidatus Omnitrophica bacterium]|nr:BatD family protein [Candidatus Omnitrophota bacterium]